MAKRNMTPAGTNAEHVRQQNQQAAGKNQAGQAGQFGTEFASETDVQSVRQKNQQSQAKKSQNQQ
ncbi:gamma-type small acid-soluble spore protein [Scopulibacillus cellulosilyticus]|uniref:Small, acid-soluble spore protein gamma-type n=1 Tax=Scopulibacillus cellulosilyticus TaxID=2665665 RepID=A0ABW2PX67_9BACL